MKRFLGLALWLAWLPAHADLEGLRTAAQAGDANAQLELGQLYEFGFGLKENAVPAMAWYLAGSRNGNARAGERAAVLKPKLSAAQQQEAERLSREWAPTTRAAATPTGPAAPNSPAQSAQTPKNAPAPSAPQPEAASSTPPPAPVAPARAKASPAPSPQSVKPAQADPSGARPSSPTGPAPAPEESVPPSKPADDDKLGPG